MGVQFKATEAKFESKITTLSGQLTKLQQSSQKGLSQATATSDRKIAGINDQLKERVTKTEAKQLLSAVESSVTTNFETRLNTTTRVSHSLLPTRLQR